MEVDEEAQGAADRAALYPQLRRAVINELRTPDLLPYQDKIMEYYLTETKNVRRTRDSILVPVKFFLRYTKYLYFFNKFVLLRSKMLSSPCNR